MIPHLLALPQELRTQIFLNLSHIPDHALSLNHDATPQRISDCLVPDMEDEELPAYNVAETYPAELVLVCREFRQEIDALYWSCNSFTLSLYRDISTIKYFLEPGFRDHRRTIKKLALSIHRWGTKTFFLDEVIPVLEDTVLNGQLRDLEVKVRRHHLFNGFDGNVIRWEGERGFVDWLERMDEEDRAWWKGNFNDVSVTRALVKLLEDPYLERTKLVVWWEIPFSGTSCTPAKEETADISYFLAKRTGIVVC